MIRKLTMAAFASLVVLCSPAVAEPLVKADAQQISAILQQSGYKAKVDKDSTGDPMIESGASGYIFYIYFYGCEKGANCTSLQFEASFDPGNRTITLEDINSYNVARRFGTGALDKNGDPVVRMDVDLEAGGMSKELFLDNFAFWETTVARFADMVFSKEVNTTKAPAK